MKQYYALSLLLFAQVPLHAQTLDNAGVSPVPGDHFSVLRGNLMPEGPAGASQTWNFASLTSTLSAEVTYVTPASTTYASSFPGSTVAQAIPNQAGTYAFYSASSSALDQIGLRDASAGTIYYSNSERVLQFPCSYNSTWTDPFSASFETSGYPVERSGSVTATADAFGTVVMPYGTFNNVLRIHVTEDFSDDIQDLYQVQYNSDHYLFYKNGLHLPLLGLYDFTTTVFDNPTQTQYSQWAAANSVGIEEALKNSIGIDVYPDPATDHINISFGSEGGLMDLEALDVNGKVVLKQSENLALGIDVRTLDITALNAGIYYLRVTAKNGQQGVRRFIVE